MRYLKSFNESIQFETDPESVREILFGSMGIVRPPFGARRFRGIYTDIENRTRIDPDGTVNVEGDIYIETFQSRLPIKFGIVTGTFKFYRCDELTSLEGSPRMCENFYCDDAPITSLEGCPQEVENFHANSTKITSLEGAPQMVKSNFSVENNNIKSLIGAPKFIGGNFYINRSGVTSLEGCPDTIQYALRAESCRHLTSLKGIEGKNIGLIQLSPAGHRDTSGKIYDPSPLRDCQFDRLTSGTQPFWELVELFNDTDVPLTRINLIQTAKDIYNKFKDSLDYNYVRSGPEGHYINLFRFKEALYELDIVPNLVTLKNYEFRDDSGRVVDFNGNPI